MVTINKANRLMCFEIGIFVPKYGYEFWFFPWGVLLFNTRRFGNHVSA